VTVIGPVVAPVGTIACTSVAETSVTDTASTPLKLLPKPRSASHFAASKRSAVRAFSVRSAESWDGVLVRVLRRSMTKALQNALDSGLQHLKTEAERQAKATAPKEPV
jgi:hypothetical protein